MINSAGWPFPISLILRYFWLLAILITFVNVPFIKTKINPYIKQDPSCEDGYNKLIMGITLYFVIPWLIVGVGVILGKLDTIFDVLFGLRTLNVFSVLFFGTMIAESLLFFVWVWFLGGAEFLSKHPGFFDNIKFGQSPVSFKTLAAAGLAINLVVIFILANFPIASF